MKFSAYGGMFGRLTLPSSPSPRRAAACIPFPRRCRSSDRRRRTSGRSDGRPADRPSRDTARAAMRSVRRRAGRRVVHVEVDVRPRLDQLSRVALILFVAAARHVRQQLLDFLRARAAVRARHLVARHRLAVRVDDTAVDEPRAVGQPVDHVEARVMNHARRSGPHFERLHVHVVRERRLGEEIGDRHFAFSGDREVDRHLDHDIRLAVRPAGRRRSAPRGRSAASPLRRAGVHPFRDRLYLRGRQAAIVAGTSRSAGSAPHGGISRLVTLARIDFAHGRTSSYERSDIGATSPGRWQPTQLV